MFNNNVFNNCFVITTCGNMLSCQKNYVLREMLLKNRMIVEYTEYTE